MVRNGQHANLLFLSFCLNPKAGLPEKLSAMDWEGLYHFACEQAVAGICYQGIEKVNAYLKQHEGEVSLRDVFQGNTISEDLMLSWVEAAVGIRKRNIRANEAVSRFTSYMHKKGFGFFVFKGQTVGCLYEWPEARTSGDVDFYVCHADWDEMLENVARKTTVTNHLREKHVEFKDGSISFEMHFTTATFVQRAQQEYWDAIVEDDLAHNRQPRDGYGGGEYRHFAIVGGEKIPMMSPTLCAVYLFVHIYHHFMKEGIGLRQFCDWLVFLRAKRSEIDRRLLDDILAKLGYTKAYRAFGCILVDFLGLEEGAFPYTLSDKDRRWSNKILDVILSGGNFGRHGRIVSKSGAMHSLETGLRSVVHVCRFYTLTPKDNIRLIPKLFAMSWRKYRENGKKVLAQQYG